MCEFAKPFDEKPFAVNPVPIFESLVILLFMVT